MVVVKSSVYRLAVVSLLAWVLYEGTAAQAQPGAQIQAKVDKATDLKSLLKERHDLLKEVVVRLMAQYQAGAVDLTKVVQAEREAHNATLDFLEDPKERIAAVEKYQTTVVAIVQMADARAKAGVGTTVDVLQAKAMLAEARIELLRLKLKTKPRS